GTPPQIALQPIGQVFQQHRHKRRRRPVPRNVGKIKDNIAFVNLKVIEEVATQVERWLDQVVKLQPVDFTATLGKQLELNVASRPLIGPQFLQVNLELLVGTFKLLSITLVQPVQAHLFELAIYRLLHHREI